MTKLSLINKIARRIYHKFGEDFFRECPRNNSIGTIFMATQNKIYIENMNKIRYDMVWPRRTEK
jgi:hypothetical protein